MHKYETTVCITVPDHSREVTFDKDGFIHNPDLWNKNIARTIAKNEWMLCELTESHWQVIQFVRDYYLDKGAAPLMRQVCRQMSLSKYQTVGLFSNCLQVWKIAGLPNPGDEALVHMH